MTDRSVQRLTNIVIYTRHVYQGYIQVGSGFQYIGVITIFITYHLRFICYHFDEYTQICELKFGIACSIQFLLCVTALCSVHSSSCKEYENVLSNVHKHMEWIRPCNHNIYQNGVLITHPIWKSIITQMPFVKILWRMIFLTTSSKISWQTHKQH